MINMAFMPLYMWEMWDVTPVTDEHTDTRTVESRAVFSLSWIRKRRNLVISVIFPDLHALPPNLHHEMLGKLLQGSFLIIVVKHISPSPFPPLMKFFLFPFSWSSSWSRRRGNASANPDNPLFSRLFLRRTVNYSFTKDKRRVLFFLHQAHFCQQTFILQFHGKFNKRHFFVQIKSGIHLHSIWSFALKENLEVLKYFSQPNGG